MTHFVPIFPLNIVVFPGEKLNLHIFEPRYLQLIKECVAEKKEFLIPVLLENKQQELATKVRVVSIDKQYESGELDIKCIGQEVYNILEVIEDVPDKLYQGAIAYKEERLDNVGLASKMQSILKEMDTLHNTLGVKKEFGLPKNELKTYDIAHHLGLSLAQEYELLCLPKESQRQEYLLRHLRSLLPTLTELNNLTERIKLNGHYRKLSSN